MLASSLVSAVNSGFLLHGCCSLLVAVEADRQVRNMLEKSTFQPKGIKKTSKKNHHLTHF